MIAGRCERADEEVRPSRRRPRPGCAHDHVVIVNGVRTLESSYTEWHLQYAWKVRERHYWQTDAIG